MKDKEARRDLRLALETAKHQQRRIEDLEVWRYEAREILREIRLKASSQGFQIDDQKNTNVTLENLVKTAVHYKQHKHPIKLHTHREDELC